MYQDLTDWLDDTWRKVDAAARYVARQIARGNIATAVAGAERFARLDWQADQLADAVRHEPETYTLDLMQCGCGRALQWESCEQAGIQLDERGKPELLLVNCPCGSTHATEL